MKEYRARISSDPELHELYKQKDRERKKESLHLMSETEKENKRKKGAEATETWRKKKKALQESQDRPASLVPNDIYRTPAALGKAVARAKRGLPNSPHRQAVIVQKLFDRLPFQVLPVKQVSRHANALSENIEAAVEEYYLSDDISRVSPGKADFITIKQADGSKVTKQKRHMLMTLGEAHSLFKEDQPQFPIGKSKFADLRPEFVLTFVRNAT
jgi:hypothetical protein